MTQSELIGQRIRDLRRKQAWTLRDLAALSGVSYATISRIETNRRGVRLDLADAIAKALGTTLAELVK